jgi:hypothetical protein
MRNVYLVIQKNWKEDLFMVKTNDDFFTFPTSDIGDEQKVVYELTGQNLEEIMGTVGTVNDSFYECVTQFNLKDDYNWLNIKELFANLQKFTIESKTIIQRNF